MHFAAINSGIDLRDFPDPEPVIVTILDWEFWCYFLILILLILLWMIYRKRKNSLGPIDSLEIALKNVGQHNIPSRVRYQSVYTALRGYLATRINISWNYLTAQEITSAWKELIRCTEVETANLQEQWIQIESLAYGHDEITETHLESAAEFARNLVIITRREYEK